MNKRLNITLPEQTIRLIDRISQQGDRSRLIDHAVNDFVRRLSRKELRKQLKEAAIAMAEEDLKIAEEWFPIDEEAWQLMEK